MSINTDIWGTPETWEQPAGTFCSNAGIKLPVFGNDSTYKNTLAGAFSENVFTWGNEIIDISFSPWGIGKNSAIANHQYLYLGCNVGSTYEAVSNVHIYTREIYEVNGDLPYMPTYGLTENRNTKGIPQYNYQYTPFPQAFTNVKAQYNTKPILTFKYNNIVILPWIMCCKEDNTQNSGYSFNNCSVLDYFNTYKTEYPYICSLFIKGFYSGDRPDVQTSRTWENSDYTNLRATIAQWTANKVKNYPSAWDGNFTQYIYPFYWGSAAMYQTICGLNPNIQGAMTFSLVRNQDYANDDIAFARWTYQSGSSYIYSIKGDMFEYDYKQTASTIYVTPLWSNATIEDVAKQVAYLGYWFTFDVDKAKNAYIGQYCTDNDMYIPVFDDNGVTTGEYKRGTEAAAIAPDDNDTPWDFIHYDPYAPPVPPDDSDSGDLGNFRNFTDTTHFNYPCTVYALTETNFRNFAEALNALYLTDEDTTQMELDFKGSNPTDYIINCYALPFEPNFLSGSEVGVQIGPQTLLNITGKVVNTATSFYIDCGSKTIPRRGNFLDFEPYTHIELYLPMCGTITLDPALVVGKTIRVVMYYNILTNSATAAVYRLSELGDSLIATSTGEIGISIPFSAYNMGQYQNAIKATENAIKQNGLKVATGVATTAVGIAGALLAPETGGLSLALTGAALAGGSSALSAAMKGGELHYELEHIAPSVSQCSSADGSLAHVVAKTIPWLFIKRARMLQSYDEEVYAKTIGHACCINDILGGSEENPRSGLTVCSNIDTSNIAATVDEINAIKQALASGVIL